MSVNLYSPEAIKLGGATRLPPESGEAEESTGKNLEPESESESDESLWVAKPDELQPDWEAEPDESDLESNESYVEMPNPWDLKPRDELTESDFAMYDDDPYPYKFSHKNFTYKNKAMLDREKILDELRERVRQVDAWDIDTIHIPKELGLCGGVRFYRITEDTRPRLIHLSNLALQEYINDNQGAANLEFDELVKSNYNVGSTLYYITFTAKDRSNNSPAQTTFQAKVFDKLEPEEVPEVLIIRLKPT